MMKEMKLSESVLVLSCVLCVSADVFHENLYISGCSDTEGEALYSLDGDELWYADFIHKRGVEPQPTFIDHISYKEGTYEAAVADQQICKANLNQLRRICRDVPLELDPPDKVMIYTRDHLDHGANNTLICYVTGFYPAPVKIYWTRNVENVTHGASTSVPHLNKDGFFSQTSRLQFVPHRGDIYGCTVEHPALDQPLTRFWDVQVKPLAPGRGPVVFWGLCLTAALLAVMTGTFFLILQLIGLNKCC
ncbi:mamu class II histocompatibility antigen, DR alpha chain-like [Anabas testudineus]|uniref:Ig-like domain-containing protein n=1 Tax=Anabas testudineus TaxID=64144 RepID=A0A3Q1HGU6_ANATE|nr:mamu class II histocompatibility antigen, DR alpha chain-like [Anabas testudineus]